MLRFLQKRFSFFQFPRPFWYLTIGSFINRAGNFVMPFFVLYLTKQRGLPVSQATLVISLMGFGALGASIIGGIVADTFGRRMTILLGLIVGALAMLVLSSVQALPLIIVCAIAVQFFNQLIRPALSAMVADMIPAQRRTQAYSLRYWMNNIGYAIGPVVAGLVAPFSYLLLFLGDALTTLLASVVVWFGVPETLSKGPRGRQERQPEGQLRTAFTNPLLWAYSILALLFNCMYVQWGIALPLDMSAHGLSELSYGGIMAVNSLQIVLISLPLTTFFARRSPNVALAVAALILGLGLGLYAWLPTLAGYAIGMVIWTCGEIISTPLSTAVITSISPTHQRGLYQGIFETVRSLADILAPVFGGFIFQYFGAPTLWKSCLAMGILVTCAYLVLDKVQQAIKQKEALAAGTEAEAGD